MLQSLRDRTQGWLTGALLFILCVGFGIFGLESYLGSGAGQGDVVAKVNGEKILQSELNNAYERLRQTQALQLGADFQFNQKIETQLKRQALDQLILSKILLQDAQHQKYRVNNEDVDRALLSIPAFQVDGRFSREHFKNVLSSLLYTEASFLETLKTTMLIDQVRLGFIESSFVLPHELENAVQLINQRRDFTYTILSPNLFYPTIQVSDKEALLYYQKHPQSFTSPEQVSIQYLELSLPQIASQMQFDEAALKRYYQDNLNNYTQPAKWRIASILVKLPQNGSLAETEKIRARIKEISARLEKGENFSQLARLYSDDSISAKKGGELPWFSTGMVDPNLEKAVAGLKNISDITGPIQTTNGFYFVKLLDRQKAKVQSFESVRSQVQKALAQQKAGQIFGSENDKLANLTYTNPTSLDVAAKSLNLQVKTTNFFDRQGGKEAITTNPKIRETAFSRDVLEGNNSGVIELTPDTVIVLRVKQHKPATLEPFDEVRERVLESVRREKSEKENEQLAQTITQALKQGADPMQISRKYNLTWTKIGNASRYDAQVPMPILSKVFQMPAPTQKTTISHLKLSDSEQGIIILSAIHQSNLNQIPAVQKRIYQEELENSLGRAEYALYVDSLVKKSKVKVIPVKPS